jgi:hypothetical protein
MRLRRGNCRGDLFGRAEADDGTVGCLDDASLEDHCLGRIRLPNGLPVTRVAGAQERLSRFRNLGRARNVGCNGQVRQRLTDNALHALVIQVRE